MNKVTLLSPMTGDGSHKSPFRPQFSDDYKLVGYEDITGRDVDDQPGSPALVMIEARCNDTQLTAIEADGNYYVMDVEEADDVEIPA